VVIRQRKRASRGRVSVAAISPIQYVVTGRAGDSKRRSPEKNEERGERLCKRESMYTSTLTARKLAKMSKSRLSPKTRLITLTPFSKTGE